MNFEHLIGRLHENAEKEALIWSGKTYTYRWLHDAIEEWQAMLNRENIEPSTVVLLEADFSPNSLALFMALAQRRAILVPLTSSANEKKNEFNLTAETEVNVYIDENDTVSIRRLPTKSVHSLYKKLRKREHAGLVLFSSGSTGKSKAVLHDLSNLLEKFSKSKKVYRSISFLLYDHIGGINTMLHVLSGGGCLVTLPDRSPDSVLSAIEKHKVELLPTSPTFLNLILLSEAYLRYDISSLKMITYGTEPMPKATLKRFHALFPAIKLKQTYGLSEVGILQSASKGSDSLWVKLGGEGFKTRIVDGILQIKAQSAMLGYLNYPSPFTEDGWFVTGDKVELEGEYFRIIGRASEMINVGGEKVHPVEVENAILTLDNVSDATVYGEKNPILGQIVCANVALCEPEEKTVFSFRLKKHCRAKLPPYMVPIKINVVDAPLHNPRFKKKRVLNAF